MTSEEKTKKIRLFTALQLPPAFKDQLSALPRKGLAARWTHPDDLHITLRFLGDVEQTQLPAIKEALARVRRPSFHVEVDGLGSFQTRRQVIFWAGAQSIRKLTALAGDINEVLAPLGFDMPRKPYQPHITLARLKTKQGLAQYIRQHEHKVKYSWQAQAYSLVLSAEPDEKGSRYSSLEEYSLGSKA